ncbi:MAG: hypothetical protein FJX46_16965 [Alphaproteobacteria bacterium]|nr:hypothetical protein [Alphaproteobacteria bacterium]
MLALLVFVFLIACSGRGGSAAERVILKRGDVGAEAEFLAELLGKSGVQGVYDTFGIKNLHIGRHDLNGDGRYELLIGYSGSYFCSRVSCPVDIFRRNGERWTWIGGIELQMDDADAKFEIVVNGKSRNGWSILSEREFMICWTIGTGNRVYAPLADSTESYEFIPGRGGYFLAVKPGEPCPDD